MAFHELDITRRRFLRAATITTGAGIVLGAVAAGPACASAKFTQKMALYQPTPKGAQDCAHCALFEPSAACKVVDGTVAASGWCMLYSPARK